MKLSLLDFEVLTSYPSGSGIEFFDGRIYLIGDDAGNVIITDIVWEPTGEVPLFKTIEKRIPKKEKADLESSAILQLDNTAWLLLMGSGSKKQRNKGFLLDLNNREKIEFDCSIFYDRIKNSRIEDLNIEGATQVNNHLVFGNRGNKTNPGNHLIITTPDFFRHQEDAPFKVINIKISNYPGAIGLSGLTYSVKHDYLLFTTSMEDTKNSIDDGPIGKSYLGVIKNADQEIAIGNIEVNELIDLAAGHEKFAGKKIESVCIVKEEEKSMQLQMVADNDTGVSYLFNLLLEF